MEGVPGKLKIAYFVTLKACLLYDCKTVIGIPLKSNPCGESVTNGSSSERVRCGTGGGGLRPAFLAL